MSKEDFEEKNDGSLILTAVQAIAISPEKAKKWVTQYKKAAQKSHPDYDETQIEKIVSEKIISKYSSYSSLSGGLTAIPGAIPGVGTLISAIGGGTADLTACMKIQIDMTMLLATNYGWDLTDHDALHMTMLIALSGGLEKLGVQTGAPVASKAGVKMLQQYLKGAVLVTVKEFFKKFGIAFSRKALEKSIPFGVGIAAGSGLNYILTQYIGKEAVKAFTIEREMRSLPNS
ncbi:EcsC family protein [Acetobacter cerevisiae]|uniref:EcsC family protein n=1 Tax=Acetobacter cerevisiae TaxID=178900 RepID=A0A149VAX6_9PROT|nr:EcsC family protein [Acetobacter cerevisiae]KXV77389.1 hypothetical protein AD954_06785 [Acetobacter cerevisiae]